MLHNLTKQNNKKMKMTLKQWQEKVPSCSSHFPKLPQGANEQRRGGRGLHRNDTHHARHHRHHHLRQHPITTTIILIILVIIININIMTMIIVDADLQAKGPCCVNPFLQMHSPFKHSDSPTC